MQALTQNVTIADFSAVGNDLGEKNQFFSAIENLVGRDIVVISCY